MNYKNVLLIAMAFVIGGMVFDNNKQNGIMAAQAHELKLYSDTAKWFHSFDSATAQMMCRNHLDDSLQQCVIDSLYRVDMRKTVKIDQLEVKYEGHSNLKDLL